MWRRIIKARSGRKRWAGGREEVVSNADWVCRWWRGNCDRRDCQTSNTYSGGEGSRAGKYRKLDVRIKVSRNSHGEKKTSLNQQCARRQRNYAPINMRITSKYPGMDIIIGRQPHSRPRSYGVPGYGITPRTCSPRGRRRTLCFSGYLANICDSTWRRIVAHDRSIS